MPLLTINHSMSIGSAADIYTITCGRITLVSLLKTFLESNQGYLSASIGEGNE